MQRIELRSVLIVIAILASFARSGRADETRISQAETPKAVLDAVHNQYPAGKLVSFERERQASVTSYEVQLTLGDEKAGTRHLDSRYGRMRIEKVERSQQSGDRAPRFELVVSGNGQTAEAVFDAAGKLVKEKTLGRR